MGSVVAVQGGSLIKGIPTPAFQSPVSAVFTSTRIIDTSSFNAIHVDVFANMPSVTFDVTIEETNSSSGIFNTVTEGNGTKSGLTGSSSYNVLIGGAFVRVRISSWSGTSVANQGVQVYVTPFIAGGTTTISSTSVANQNLSQVSSSTITLGQNTLANSLPVAIASNQSAVASNITQVGSSAIALGSAVSASSLPVVIASNQGAVAHYLGGTTTATVTVVACAFASTALIAANTARKGLTIYNDSATYAHIKLGTGGTTTDFTRILAAIATNVGGYWEIPFGYTGAVSAMSGVAAPSGNWRITELT